MKLLISSLLFSVSFNLYAGSIHQCEDAQGNMSFSSEPCQEHTTTLSTLDAKSGKNRRLKNTAIKRVIINNQNDFNAFIDNLEFKNMSEVLSGLQSTRFHGVKLSYLLKQENIQHITAPKKNNTLQYVADIKRSNTKNTFSVGYELNVNGKDSHPFLNLPNPKLISRMQSLGFGKPKVENDVYNWTWRDGSLSCGFKYKRSQSDNNKFFKYTCSEFGR